MRSEVLYLRRRLRCVDCVLVALAHTDLCNEVLSRLRGGQSVESIAAWLNQNPLQDFYPRISIEANSSLVTRSPRADTAASQNGFTTEELMNPMRWAADIDDPAQTSIGHCMETLYMN